MYTNTSSYPQLAARVWSELGTEQCLVVSVLPSLSMYGLGQSDIYRGKKNTAHNDVGPLPLSIFSKIKDSLHFFIVFGGNGRQPQSLASGRQP